jgi:ubiquitin thioesterase protein OTUB1
MQKYPDDYQPYMSEPVQTYVTAHIEPAICEIEHVGLSALLAVLVQPAGIAANVHYLDRSPGEEINTYPYASTSTDNHVPTPTIRLLYRPGHYDILYKAEDLLVTRSVAVVPTTQPSQQNVFVALQHASTETLHHRTAFQPETIEIPGMSFYTGPQASWPQAFNQYDLAASPVSPAIASPRAPVTPSYPGVPNVAAHDMYFQSTPMSQSTLPTMTLAHHLHIDRDTRFRPSAWEFEVSYQGHNPHQLCQTAIFRK